jgi:hypothetical protein
MEIFKNDGGDRDKDKVEHRRTVTAPFAAHNWERKNDGTIW